tara:strand:+ start:19 stop:357 length:339 start_codon:yes stop_codon:yes gene_type:complete
MGYTNYWHQHEDFTNRQWRYIKAEAEYMKEIGNNVIELECDDDHIIINGTPNCETFVLSKRIPTKKDYEQQDLTFNFCKTRRLPYDIYVWHLLVFCAGMINDTDVFSISRDR